MPMPRRHALSSIALVLLLSGCGSAFTPTSIEIDRGRIEEAIAARFPYETRWLGVLDVRASAPKLRLLPERNRIATDVELSVDERLSARQLRGALAFESGLRYEPSDASLRLSDVTVQRIALAGLPELLSSQTGRLGSVMAEQLLEDAVLYRLTDAQQQMLRQRGVEPGEIRVTPRGLTIEVVPRPAP